MNQESSVAALKALIGTKAETVFQKYQLLEQRDKILRKDRQRVHDVHSATVFVGTCQDMCPEKERYEREVQKRLAVYEVVQPSMGSVYEATVDHRRAVKDYGRSAADQEEPLPHELRPAPVLDMTMTYLLTEIAYNEPTEESQLAGWYDFLWKRTRAIRKDMTQQMLEGDVALSLLEKCARFHIFCAHRLCELDMGEFDQKMNTENLTKCLQSLKHLYEDMAKKGLICENEAEFRSYDVLLSLNDTDVLRQILTYNFNVRESPHIRFALKLFAAMQNNNYVEFFRLIRRRATFLQACIAHRYFNDVRAKALNTLVRSYSINSQLPISDLVRWLGFESDIEALDFASLHGLTTHPQDGSILILNRSHMLTPEEAPTLKRSNILVESKRMWNLGEVLNGGPISRISLPTPVISFDENHYYRFDRVVNDILQSGPAQEKSKNGSLVPTLNSEQRLAERAIMSTAAAVLGSVVRSTLTEMATIELTLAETVHWIISDVIGSALRSTATQALDSEKKRTLQQRQQEALTKELETVRQKIFDEILTGVVASMAERLAQEVRSQTFRTQIAQRARRFASEVQEKILAATIREEIDSLCSTYHRQEVQSPLESLRRIKENLTNILARRYFTRWRNNVLAKVYQLKVLNDFPSCPMSSMNEYRPPPEKRTKLSYGSTITSPYNWPEVLEARKFKGRATELILNTVIDSTVQLIVLEEIRRQKLWTARFGNDHFMMAAGPSTRVEIENAKKRIFSEFSSQPLPSDFATPVASGGIGLVRAKDATESAYTWMDTMPNSGSPSTQQNFLTGATPAPTKSKVDKNNSDEGIDGDGLRRNYFSEISLTPSEAFRKETLEIAKQLRLAVQSEKHAGEAELQNWKQVLNGDMGEQQE